MAWVDGQWKGREERAAIIATYSEYLGMMDDRYDVDDMDIDTLAEYLTKQRELTRLRRIHRCENDQLEFAIEYFSEAHNPGNPGNWDGFDVASKEDAAEFHAEIAEVMDAVSTTNLNAKTAVAAPRSHAKSTYLTKNFPLHQVVFRKRKYIIIISETPSVSVPNLEWLSSQLKFNTKLREDFGPLLSQRQQENVKDNSAEFVAWEPGPNESKRQLTKVEAASSNQALRGRNWNGTRPDLVICDDLEDGKTNAATEEQRAKLREWFQSVVMPLGDPKGEKTAIVYMGTTVHFDSLLMRILYKRSDFTTRIYRALIDHPTNKELWEQCREIYQEHENEHRRKDAEAFYAEHYEAMNEGVKVLWAESQTIWKLMTWRWDNGSKAFNTEYQNNPLDEDSMIFNPEAFTYWDDDNPDRRFPHSEYIISMGFDFGMGKQRGDYSAIITVATHRETRVRYIIDAWGDRVHPDKFLEVGVTKVIDFEPDVIGVESQMAQEWFADKLKEYLQARGFPGHTRVKKIYQRSRKELRIESMLPDIESGKTQFCRRHHLLIEQFERYGQGSHDDLPDACEISIRVSNQAKRRLTQKPSFL